MKQIRLTVVGVLIALFVMTIFSASATNYTYYAEEANFKYYLDNDSATVSNGEQYDFKLNTYVRTSPPYVGYTLLIKPKDVNLKDFIADVKVFSRDNIDVTFYDINTSSLTKARGTRSEHHVFNATDAPLFWTIAERIKSYRQHLDSKKKDEVKKQNNQVKSDSKLTALIIIGLIVGIVGAVIFVKKEK